MTVSPIAREILSYLDANPDARDTIEGIVDWWLLTQFVERRVREVRQAVEELVGMGYLVQRRGADSRDYYLINPANRAEIEGMLPNSE